MEKDAFWRMLGRILGGLALLQLAKTGLTLLIFRFLPRTNFSDRIVSAVLMLCCTALIILFARRRGYPLSVFPARIGAGYIAAAAAVTLLLASAALLFCDQPIDRFLLLYGCIVTPLYEELLFRGLVWERLAAVLERPWQVWLVNALLFGVWHLGYVASIAFRVQEGLAVAMLWKMAVGLGFGVVLGALRLRTKNCFSTMLLHAATNVFGR